MENSNPENREDMKTPGKTKITFTNMSFVISSGEGIIFSALLMHCSHATQQPPGVIRMIG